MTVSESSADSIIGLEYSFVKVPFEETRRQFRGAHRLIEKELASLHLAEDGSKLIAKARLLMNKLMVYFDGACKQRERTYGRLQEIANFLENQDTAECPERMRWQKLRPARLITEFLLQRGFLKGAKALACQLNAENSADSELFEEIQSIKQSLASRNAGPALHWCLENRSQLKKLASDLEFLLRRQEFIELCRRRDLKSASEYARKYLMAYLESNRAEVEQVLALMAVHPSTVSYPYNALYAPERWTDLIEQLDIDFRRLYSLSDDPQLVALIAAGLSSLKTLKCGKENEKNLDCPVCCGPLSGISGRLPYAHHENSSLVCRITGEVMDADNPPMALPNGYVYSQKAVFI